jgi:CheY-like chemotaxis protein/signal transduction histidine kinase
MADKGPRGFVGFLREARRRKVYVSAVGYVGASAVLIEITGAVADALLFPDWTSRLVTFLLILGFPVVLILSWTFDITGKGVVRTSDLDREAVGAAGPGRGRGSASSAGQGRTGAPRLAMPAIRRRRPVAVEDEAETANPQDLDPERVRRATLAHMRHELRTPINGIIGYSEILLEDEEDEAFTGDLERIRGGGQQLLGLIDQVLGTGAAAGKDRELENYAEQIRMDLRTPVTSVMGYAEMLLETAQEEGRDELIPDLTRIHTSAKRLLELSNDIVGLATGGKATESEEGSAAADLTRSVLSKIRPSRGEGAGEAEGRLLVVDDNAMNRDLLSRQLARQGYIVLTAPDGAEALRILESQTVDLILLDVIMPKMDGVETLRRLKAKEGLREIPVLMLSSLDEVDGALRCIELGAEDYLSKPVRAEVLEVRIGANLELYRMRERERAYEDRLMADESFIDRLLLSAFPEGAAERVRVGEPEVADEVPEATVLSCHLKGFSALSSSGEFGRSLPGLRELWGSVEALAREHGVETCIWRADGFVAVAGAPSPVEDHVERAASLGRALVEKVAGFRSSTGDPLRLGLGLHTGRVIAAALGGERLRYEVWGEGVKMAEGVAEDAPDGTLLASPTVYARLKDRYSFEPRKVRDIAGMQMRTYLFQDGRPADSD